MTIAHTFANTTFDWGFLVLASSTPTSLALVAGETGVATFAAAVVLAVVLLTTAKVWKAPPATATPTSRHDATLQSVGAR